MTDKACSSIYVWCNKEDRRIPAFRCFVCGQGCYAERYSEAEASRVIRVLIETGKYKECFVMKRKERGDQLEIPGLPRKDGAVPEAPREQAAVPPQADDKLFVLADGQLKPFSAADYTAAVLYQVSDSFAVECKLVRPDDTSTVVYDGRKPSKRTVPILITKEGESLLLDSWEALEAKPEQLARAAEVIGAVPVKQVFVLKRKSE